MRAEHRAAFAVIFSTMLAACGGGSDNSSGTTTTTSTASTPSSTPTPQSGTDPAASAKYFYSGSAPTVTGLAGAVSVIFSPNGITHNSLIGAVSFAQSTPLAGQVQQAAYGGAFTTVNIGNGGINLTEKSTIADINGIGGYVAIGRWTKGSDSSGGNYNANQGGVYAVGNPLTLTAGSGTLACSAVMSTSPTSFSGNVAPGTLSSATATLDMTTLTLTNFAATVTIGSDVGASFTKASIPLKGVAIGGGMTTVTETVGNDPSKPLVALAYGVQLPSTGDINGMVVLSCH